MRRWITDLVSESKLEILLCLLSVDVDGFYAALLHA